MTKEQVHGLIRPIVKERGSTITGIRDFGDAFAIHYVNDEYYKSRDPKDELIGTGSIIYIKSTGEA